MMKIVLNLFCLLVFSSVATASVDPFDIVVLADHSNQSVIFRTTVSLDRTTDFEIYSLSGDLLFQEELAPGTFLNKRFKHNNFSEGGYTLILADERGRTELPLTISTTSITTNRDLALRTQFPVVDMKSSGVLVVNCRNKPCHRVSLRLTDHAGEEIFSEEVDGNATVRRSYQLNKLAAGEYLVTISSKDVQNYTAAITLR